MPYQLAVCAEMHYLDLPLLDRISTIHKQGFQVEIWDFASKNLPQLAATGATFSSMTGYIRGNFTTEAGRQELIETARLALEASLILDLPRLNLHGTGLGEGGLPVLAQEEVTGYDWIKAADTLRQLGDEAAKFNKTFILENLNTAVDHPGTPWAKAEDTLALVQAVDHPNIRLNLDLYHAQIGEGNLIQLLERCMPWIGEIQIADVPDRCEPGTGEINYKAIASYLQSRDYQGVIALESYAKTSSDLALQTFRDIFTA